ncbi:MAG: hypothetical protein IJ797_10895 [Selenomonadaceae bacterium]|nr:hypothetical protein [Selenomonadaceae bacterium]
MYNKSLIYFFILLLKKLNMKSKLRLFWLGMQVAFVVLEHLNEDKMLRPTKRTTV